MFEDLVRGLMVLVDRGFMTRELADEIITRAVQNIYLSLSAENK